MPRCLISLGANLGDPLKTIGAAAELLQHRLQTVSQGFKLSRLFRTPPVGGPAGQPPFVNAVLAVETRLSSLEVWQAIRDVEQELGRQRDRRWEARRIDLDILLYEQQRIWTPHLKIPHPRMCMRRFILLPALDVAADWIDPVTQQSLRKLAEPLQAGPGSLWLVSKDPGFVQPWLDEVAELAAAQIRPANDDQACAPHGARWISLVALAAFEQAITRGSANGSVKGLGVSPKLTVFLAEPSRDPRAAWETQHLELAECLRLSDPGWQTDDKVSDGEVSDGQVSEAAARAGAAVAAAGAVAAAEVTTELAPTSGWCAPRYLLPGDDRQWAIHEMLSALEAMDCPIEPI